MVQLSNKQTTSEIQTQAEGFRLEQLEVYNWGTFNTHIWAITPRGGTSLLTGANGSGKSTMIDALLTLLVPNQRRSYNLASGSEKARERDERSYILGAWGKQKDLEKHSSKPQYLRERDAHAILLAVFRNGKTGQAVTLAQVLWIEESVRKFFVVAPATLSIETHFRGVAAPADLRKQLRAAGAEIFQEFAAYGRRFRQMMGFRSEKALDLFNQIVSIKEIGGLNAFVREHMLEKTDAQLRIRQLRENFDNLTRAHDAIQLAEHQLEILEPLMQDAHRYDEQQRRISETQSSQTFLHAYIANRRKLLLQQLINELRQSLEPCASQRTALEQELKQLREREVSLSVAISKDDAGQQIAQFQREIQNLETRRHELELAAERYSRLARQLGLPGYSDETTFFATRRQLEQLQGEIEQELVSLREKRDAQIQQLSQLQSTSHSLEVELQSLQQRDSQIPADDMLIRHKLVKTLELEESDLPFVGELLRVRQSEKRWEPALERLLRGFARQMLVPEQLYIHVSRYVDQTNLHGRLVYHRVKGNRAARHDGHMTPEALYHKVEIRPDTPFTGWLSAELIDGFDYLCCETLEEFQRAQRGVTLQGQIKHGPGRHEKDDRHELGNRRHYVLGWNNREKLRVLQNELDQVSGKRRAVEKQIAHLDDRLTTTQNRRSTVQLVQAVENFVSIDWRSVESTRQEQIQQLQALEAKSQHLGELRARLEETRGQVSRQQAQQNELISRIATLENQMRTAQSQVLHCDRVLSEIDLQRDSASLERVERDLTELQGREKGLVFSLESVDEIRERLRQFYQNRMQSYQSQLTQLDARIVNRMRDFLQTSTVLRQEMDASLAALDEYRLAYERIRREDLPRHRRRFKDLLNEKIITDIGSFKAALDVQEDEIRRSIERLNISLGSIGYTDLTYIQLVCERSHDAPIREFHAALRECIPDVALERSSEANEASFQRIHALLKRFEEDERWTTLVTDVRNWLNFSAVELYRENDEQKNYYTDSSGKSGGQKAKLAYTILASAIAYQYGLDQDAGRERTFRFVAVDEAFSKSDEQNARYAMELFRQLDLQLLVVTPLDKIHVVEPYISACHFVANNEEENNSRVYNLSLEEYFARKQDEQWGGAGS